LKLYHCIHQQCILLLSYRSKRSSCACSTPEIYGGREGVGFTDVLNNPCDVKILDIWVRHGGNVDALQVRYGFPDGRQQTTPLRGGTGGDLTHISIPEGGKVVGIFGGIADGPGYGLLISQLRIVVMDGEQQLQIHGPFGSFLHRNPRTFAVYGDIKSFCGYHRFYLDGLGAFYEPWGECGSPCAANTVGTVA
jgi:hypothetical protein